MGYSIRGTEGVQEYSGRGLVLSPAGAWDRELHGFVRTGRFFQLIQNNHVSLVNYANSIGKAVQAALLCQCILMLARRLFQQVEWSRAAFGVLLPQFRHQLSIRTELGGSGREVV